MKPKHAILALSLSLALTLTPAALAAGVEEKFPPINQYTGYTDVEQGVWYADAARVCYETGLMMGTSPDTFSPETTMTVAQATTLAVRIHNILGGGDGVIQSPEGQPWYAGAVAEGEKLAQAAGRVDLLSCLSTPDAPISRAQFFSLMGLVADESLLAPINTVSSLPDTEDPAILSFYQAGILSGLDPYGSFKGNLTLRRGEAAAMASRIVRPELRKTFTLEEVPVLCQAAGVLPTTNFFEGNKTVTALEYLTQAKSLIDQLEAVCAQEGVEFNWFHTYGEQTFLDYVKTQAMAQLGVTVQEAAQAYKNFDLQVFYSRLIDLTPQS